MSLTVIYIHGFNSSPLSIKAQQVQAYFKNNKLTELENHKLHIPALNYQPKVAIEQLITIIDAQLADDVNSEILLIGSSLGGYYSLWLAEKYSQCRAVLINPAVYPYLLLKDLLGENHNIYTQSKYILTLEHIDQLKALDVVKLSDPERVLLLSQTDDETLDYREAVIKLEGVEQRVEQGGNHSYENFVEKIAQIFEFANRECTVRLTLDS